MQVFSRKRSRKQSGQVLLLAVLAVVILTVAILVLFDLQRIMRGKIKVMSGIDAAALTGALWQKNTLNLVGELNLVKACNVLVSDSIYGIGGNPDNYMKVDVPENASEAEIDAAIAKAREELEKLKTAADMLTEMQVRISFVGPLIGFGAAQQAAKHNGLPHNQDCGQYMSDLYDLIMDDEIYGNPDLAPQVYHNFAWRFPYANMIYALMEKKGSGQATGVAVGTSVRHLGMPNLYSDPPTKPPFIAYMQRKILMEAIDANDWCLLQALVDADDSAYSGKWWGNIKIEPNKKFLGSSEILPIHTDYSTGQQFFDFAENAEYLTGTIRRKQGRDELLFPLNRFYDKTDPVTESGALDRTDPDMKFNPLPSITWCIFDDRWQSYRSAGVDIDQWQYYLRSKFRPGHDYYSGAISYFSVRVPNSSMTRRYNLSSGFTRSGGNREKDGWKKMYDASRRSSGSIEGMESNSIRFNATAKPFGVLKTEDGTVYHPFAAAMVLPVFERAALIPVALERADGLEMEDRAWIIYLTKFLPALGSVDKLDDVKNVMTPEHYNLVESAGYIKLLRKLQDPEWRKRGRDWLNAEAVGHDVYDGSGNKIGHVIDKRNRDLCLEWRSGSGGYRTGPGELH